MLSISERPFSYNDMIGQKGILFEMKNRSKTINFAPVMLFEGETGTGKTTTALITAALINCKNPIDKGEYKDPCGQCPSCKSILEETFNRDTYFFDASQMAKEDVLKVENLARVVPLHDRNKIFIIDEAQELSKSGKGATLHLLEKKRKNVYFILNTMNVNALDKAVSSRGQCYKFKNIPDTEIAEYLFNLIEKNKLEVSDEFIEKGLLLIARNSTGSVREALQNLERCMKGKHFSEEEILEEFGFVDERQLFVILHMLIKKDPEFFKHFKKLEKKAFYFYSYKVILSLLKYKITETVDAPWKKSYYDTLIQENGKIAELLEFYNQTVYTNYYFNDDKFEGLIIKYYLKEEKFYAHSFLEGGVVKKKKREAVGS